MKETLVGFRKGILLIIALAVLVWAGMSYNGNRVQLASLVVMFFSALTTFLVALTPSIRIDLQRPEKRGTLVSPFLLENLSNVGGAAKVLVTIKADGKRCSARQLKEERYYNWRAKWKFFGKDSILGQFDFANLLPNRALPRRLVAQIDVQWYTSFGIPVDKLTRHWLFDFEKWVWVLDVGGIEFQK